LSFCDYSRLGLVGGFLAAALLTSGSCYRAEIDLTPLAGEMSLGGAGASGTGDAAGDAGSGGASDVACDHSQEDSVQTACRLEPPTKAQCEEQAADGWQGCYAGGCEVCKEMVADYPFYQDWHACCHINPTCSTNGPLKCNSRCPAPTERDKHPRCASLLP
jgi:hypothetical protein